MTAPLDTGPVDVWGRSVSASRATPGPVWDEPQRLAALRSFDILDSDDESEYDDITALAAQICGTPIAAVSLVDAERQWFKSSVGLNSTETSREVSFCSRAIETPEKLFVVPDALADERFVHNPLVTGDPAIRFYAGTPLVTRHGVALGSLCVIDQRPRSLDEGQLEALTTLGRQVTRLIEQRLASRQLRELSTGGQPDGAPADLGAHALSLLPGGVLITARDGGVLGSNEAFASGLRLTPADLTGRFVYELTAAHDILADEDLVRELLAGVTKVVRREKRFLSPDGAPIPAMVTTCLIPARSAGSYEFLDQVEWLTEHRRAENRAVVEASSADDAALSVNAAGEVIDWNGAAERMFGFNREEVLGWPLDAILRPGESYDRRRTDQAEEPLPSRLPWTAKGGSTVVAHGRHRDGRELPVELRFSSWTRGGHTYSTAVMSDVSGPRRTAALDAAVQHAGTAANDCTELPEAMLRIVPALAAVGPFSAVRAWLCDAAGIPASQPAAAWVADPAHPMLASTLGFAGPPLLSYGQPHAGVDPSLINFLVAPDGVTTVHVRAPSGSETTLHVLIRAEGEVYGVLELVGSAIVADDDELHDALVLVCAQLGRVGERARTASRLTARSLTDALTGLPNRRRVLDLLQTLVEGRHDSPAAVLFIDLDRFKAVNDTLGHGAGDEVLRAAAARMGALLREGDTLARLGGDEFLVLCTGLPEDVLIESVARRLLAAFADPIWVHGTQIYLGASIGIAAVTPEGTPETLLRQADIAMYRAKAAGGSAYEVFTNSMDTEIRRSLDTRNALHQALRRDELVVHYQPVVRLLDDKVIGLEALVRWNRPGHGLVSPVEFIQQAEDAGLIVAIGQHVVQTACRDMVRWRGEREDLVGAYIAVNVAVAQLRSDFPALISEILTATGLPPDKLTLEITEGALLSDLSRSGELLGALRRGGVRIALDDFGTGYSSLAYLSQLPVDVLKIDRSFVTPLGQSPRADALIDVVLELAQALDLDVIAEGVETQQQLSSLASRGCGAVQGFLFSPAVAAAELPAVLDRLRSVRAPMSERGEGGGGGGAQ